MVDNPLPGTAHQWDFWEAKGILGQSPGAAAELGGWTTGKAWSSRWRRSWGLLRRVLSGGTGGFLQ